MPTDRHTGHLALRAALCDLADVAREISEDPANVLFFTMNPAGTGSVQVTCDVFERLVAEESPEPDCRVSHVVTYKVTGGWGAGCNYRGHRISAGPWEHRPSFDADANLEAELAASVAAATGGTP